MEEIKNEIIAEDAIEVIENNTYTDEEIDCMCLSLKKELSEHLVISEEALELAYKIAKNSKEYLDNDTYLWTMQAYLRKFEKENNVNAKRFIQIRMKDVIDAMHQKRPYQKALSFKTTDFNECFIDEICEETSFMDEEIRTLRKQFIKLELGMGCIFFLVLNLLFHYSFVLSLGMICIVLYMNYKLSYKSLVKRYVNAQTDACKDYCKDEEIINFDLPVRNS